MKLKVLTTCDNPNHEGYQRLKSSLVEHGYDFQCIQHPFEFGHQLPIVRQWAEQDHDYTHILYTDAYDTKAFAAPAEVISKFTLINKPMLISGEKACYPHPERAGNYPESISPFKYVNGGGWMVEKDFFVYLCNERNLNSNSHDQVWLMDAYLYNQDKIKVDDECKIFQTIAFSHENEWEKIENRFRNISTNTLPAFFHGNGHTNMNWL